MKREEEKLTLYTDAGVKDGVSTHHWRLIGEDGKIIKRRTFKANELTPCRAELHTIESAIKWINRKDMMNVMVYTDSMSVVRTLKSKSDKEDIKYLQFIMRGLNMDIEWVSRRTKEIKMADYYCSELLSTVFRRAEHTNLQVTY